ncbi:MAG: twin-arginine translocase subunit TatC [Deltaproteobacteria bacterium]|nr:twin-arginine translocase subunit TatC [Deltaproteobacteria bacterium]
MTAEPARSIQSSLLEHLLELQKRLKHGLLGAALCIGVAWFFHEQLFAWIMEPYVDATVARKLANAGTLAYRGLAEAFVVYFKVALIVGGLASVPWLLFQAWLFIAPGLYKRERQLVLPFILSTIVCFGAGILFARYVLLTTAVDMLLGVAAKNLVPMIMMEEYFSFAAASMLLMGLVFETPVFISFLAMIGLVKFASLIKHWRYAVVGAFIIGALFPSPDIFTQLLIAGPLVVLYFISAGVVWLIERSRLAKLEEES